jgi:hypothetical protein
MDDIFQNVTHTGILRHVQLGLLPIYLTANKCYGKKNSWTHENTMVAAGKISTVIVMVNYYVIL